MEDDFAHIVDVVLNPTNISLSEDQYMGKPAIVFTGSYNGRMNVVAVVSDKRLDLFVQTIYVNVKKEGNLATPTGDQAPVNTPEANNGTVSSGSSIRNPGENVNKKFSDRDPAAGRVNEVLQKENARLKEDVQQLKELLKLQKTVTGGIKFTKSSVESMAGILMKANNVREPKTKLAKLLNKAVNNFVNIQNVRIIFTFLFSQPRQSIVMPSGTVRWTLAGIKRTYTFLWRLLCLRYLSSQPGRLSFAVKKYAGGIF